MIYLIIFARTVDFPPVKSLPFQLVKFNVTKSIESAPKYSAAGKVINIVKPTKTILFIANPTYNLFYSLSFTGSSIIGTPWW